MRKTAMPITRELDNLKKLESVGFSHEQAETLADVIEKSHVDSQEDLKEFFSNELSSQIGGLDNKIGSLDSKLSKEISSLDGKLSKEIGSLDGKLSKEIGSLDSKLSKEISGLDNKLSNKISDLDSKLSKEISSLEVLLMTSQKDMLIKILGIVVGTVGMAVTILKLFP
jgi:hypothetical protein